MKADDPLDPDAIVSWLPGVFGSQPHVLAGIDDDDCAVLDFPGGCAVLTTDFVNARPIVIELGIGTLRDVGRLIVAHNLSDLCGSGATPFALLVGIMVERGASTHDYMELMHGVREESERWSVPVVGGDTKLGAAWAVHGVALGFAPTPERLLLKNRAETDDDVWLSGPIGDCCAGLLALADGNIISDEEAQWARDSILVPTIPLEASTNLASLGVAHAGTDISDGLAADLHDLCAASGVGALLDAESIPVTRLVSTFAARTGVAPWTFGTVLGGDFQFAATAPVGARGQLQRMGFTRIGTVVQDAGVHVRTRNGGEVRKLTDLGHRDARDMSFSDEVRYLLHALGDATNG